MLALEVAALVVKIYKYFDIYPVRVIELQRFCDKADTYSRTLQQHGNIRFLSSFPFRGRLMETYKPMEAYFSGYIK
jgi:hypothetical protein